jgi:predicted amidohydrolase
MNLNVTLVQPDLIWENTEKNLARLEDMIMKIKDPTDLILLPELFSTGFSMNASSLAEDMNGPTIHWLKRLASDLSCCIAGSMIVKESGNFFNRLVFMFPSGKFDVYDKRHLFRMGKEHEYYNPGTKKLIVEYKKWKIRPLICYDLRFPVWSRNCMDYDVLLYLASWPESRKNVWEALLKARAIENLSYVIGVSRVGKDGNRINHTGDSILFDFKGYPVLRLPENIETIGSVELNKDKLNEFRSSFPVHLDADKFQLIQ